MDEKRDIARQVSDRTQAGDVSAAKSALSKAWRELVPEAPPRFAVGLREINPKAISELTKRLKTSGKKPPLRLVSEQSQYWVETSRGKSLRLGRLPSSETKLLNEIGSAKKYRPHLLSISHDPETSQITGVSVELVRPSAKICSSCGTLHYEDHPNCAKCRSKRRKKGPEQHEGNSLQLEEAVDALAQSAQKDWPEEI